MNEVTKPRESQGKQRWTMLKLQVLAAQGSGRQRHRQAGTPAHSWEPARQRPTSSRTSKSTLCVAPSRSSWRPRSPRTCTRPQFLPDPGPTRAAGVQVSEIRQKCCWPWRTPATLASSCLPRRTRSRPWSCAPPADPLLGSLMPRRKRTPSSI
jgi:hypothetical protein